MKLRRKDKTGFVLDAAICKVLLNKKYRKTTSKIVWLWYVLATSGRPHISKKDLLELLKSYGIRKSSAYALLKILDQEIILNDGTTVRLFEFWGDRFHRVGVARVREALKISMPLEIRQEKDILADPSTFHLKMYAAAVAGTNRLDSGDDGISVQSRQSKTKMTGYSRAQQKRIEKVVVKKSTPSLVYLMPNFTKRRYDYGRYRGKRLVVGKQILEFEIDGALRKAPKDPLNPQGDPCLCKATLNPERGEFSLCQTIGPGECIAPQRILTISEEQDVDIFLGYYAKKSTGEVFGIFARVEKGCVNTIEEARSLVMSLNNFFNHPELGEEKDYIRVR